MENLRHLCIILFCLFTQNIIAGEIDVMTQNQYFGADFEPLLNAAGADPFNPVDFNDAVLGFLQQVTANKTTERIKALAALITKRQPHLVGLQEVYAFGCIDNSESEIDACNDPSISGAFSDHLTKTLAALNDQYDQYKKVASVVNFHLPGKNPIPGVPGIPFDINNDSTYDAYLTMKDRDVILSRIDVETSKVNLDNNLCPKPSEDGCNYRDDNVFGPIVTPFGQIYLERGYVIVDATVKGKDYRFANTHLEVNSVPESIPLEIQTGQAQELIDTLNALPLEGKSLIVVGDINSSPEDQTGLPPYGMLVPPYQKFTEIYTDAWTLRPGNADGFTCCQDANLSNRKSKLNQRIDMIFSMEAPEKVKKARVLGDKVSSKTPPPGPRLWPSDHGSVAIDLQFY